MAVTSNFTDSPTLGTAAAHGPARGETSGSSKKSVNFSRPAGYNGYSEEGDVKAVQAYYEPDSVLPTYPSAPRFSLDSDDQGFDEHGRQSQELTWDGQRGEMVSQRRALQPFQEQRHPGIQARGYSSSTKASHITNTSQSNSDDTISRPGTSDTTQHLMPIKSILKKTEVEQYSEPASSVTGESTGSRHTVSDSGSGTYDRQGNWHASDADTSCLSEKEIKKLEKRGINPALYVEMKEAKSKSLVGALTGNSFVA